MIIRPSWEREQRLLPPPGSEYPILRIEHQGVYFSVLEEPVWIEGVWVGVDAWIMKNRPDVLYHNRSCGDEVSSVYVEIGRAHV